MREYVYAPGITCTEWEDGNTYFIDKNKGFHRIDGPAIIKPNDNNIWYIDGKCLFRITSQEEFENSPEYKEYIRLENLRAFE